MPCHLKPGAALVVAALMSVAGINQAVAERLPYEYFAKETDYHDVKISPDGKHFGIIFDQEGKQVLVFIRRDKMKMSGGASPLTRGNVEGFSWVNDERVIYTVSVKDSYLDSPVGSGNLYAVDHDGGRHQVIFGLAARQNEVSTSSRINRRENSTADFSVVDLLPEEKKWIVIAEYPLKISGRFWVRAQHAFATVTKLNVNTGRKLDIDKLPVPGARALTDNEGELRASIGQDQESNLLVHWKPNEDDDWQVFDMSDVGVHSAIPVSFTQDNQSIFISGEPDAGGPRAYFKLNLASGSHEMVYQNETANVIWPLRDMSNQRVVGLYTEPGLPHYEYLEGNDNETVRLHKSLRAAFKGQDIRITSQTEDAEEVIVFVYSGTNPGEYYLFNTKTNKAEFLFARSSWIDPRKLRPMQAVNITARDGMKLPAYLTLPDDSDKPGPLVVRVHGGPHGVRDDWGYDRRTQFLANRGYAVLQVNYRGSGGFGPEFETAGHGEWGAKMQDDLTDATKWAIEQGHADPKRICIIGASYGGYAALMGVTKEPDLYRCAVGSVGVYDLETFLKVGDIPSMRTGKAYMEKAVGSDPEQLSARSPAQNADKIKAKVLLVHGGEDTRVPVVHAHKMRDALEKAGNSPEWLLFEREGHGYADLDNRIEYYKKLEAFLDQNIGAEAATQAAATSP